jgi:ubiquinone biosynthesis protein Coq4
MSSRKKLKMVTLNAEVAAGEAAGAILKSILRRRYGELERFVEVFCEGFSNGRRACSLLGVKWEDLWQEPVDDLRRHFNIAVAR